MKYAISLLIFFTLLSLLIVFLFIPPIPQWILYHHFADTRQIGAIPNFWNVISNLPFCLISLWGFYYLYKKKSLNWRENIVFAVLLAGIFATGLGSAYYHWSPDNNSLVWDRIPMTIVFMSLLALTIMERIDQITGFWLLIPLLMFGISSVWYWHYTELSGYGDLRLYGFVQFYTMAIILAILYFFPKSYPPLRAYLWMFAFYVLAKFFEYTDLFYYQAGLLSGHTLKHMAAAVSSYWIVVILKEKHKIG